MECVGLHEPPPDRNKHLLLVLVVIVAERCDGKRWNKAKINGELIYFCKNVKRSNSETITSPAHEHQQANEIRKEF